MSEQAPVLSEEAIPSEWPVTDRDSQWRIEWRSASDIAHRTEIRALYPETAIRELRTQQGIYLLAVTGLSLVGGNGA